MSENKEINLPQMSKAKAEQLTKEIKALKDQIKQAKADKHDVNDGGMFRSSLCVELVP